MNLKNKKNIIEKSRYDIIIFIQAPADLRYALSIYEKNKEKEFLFCVVNVEGIYRFVKGLLLQKVEVVFIEYINYSLKNPLSILKAKAKFNSLCKIFKSISADEIYFFSRIDDYLTAGIIRQIVKNENIIVFYNNHYDEKGLQKINRFSFYYLKSWLHSKISFYITGTLFISRYYGKPLEFAFWKYKIKEIKPDNEISINKDFLYSPNNIGVNYKNVLFFLTPEDLDFITKNSKIKLISLIEKISKRKNVDLYLKGHPRLGTPDEVKLYFNHIIPDYIPAEFIDYKNIFLIIGLGTTALTYLINLNINKNVVSIVKNIDFKDKNNQYLYIKFLNELTNNRIKYASLEDIEKLLSNE